VAYVTVHLDGTGLLKSMDLDQRQSAGERCASCGTDAGNSEVELRRVGKVVGMNTPVVVCHRCNHR
jgi:hypothetical protein